MEEDHHLLHLQDQSDQRSGGWEAAAPALHICNSFGRAPLKDDILQHLFSVRMKKVLEEVSDRLIGDVPTHHYVTPGGNGRHGKSQQSSHPLSFLKAPPYLLRCPSNSMISGMAEAKRARPTVRKSTWKGRVVFQFYPPSFFLAWNARPRVVMQ